jgi:hypothetical protein
MKLMDRHEFVKACARGGALAGVVGLSAVLVSREEKFECSNRCGKCPKLEDGKCNLGLK